MPTPIESPWHDGQLLAYSGLDGPVPHATCLVAGTRGGDAPGLDIRLPGPAAIAFTGGKLERACVTSGAFSVVAGGQTVRGVLPDAHHLLISGDCRIDSCSEALRVESRPGATLIGVRAHFDSRWLDAPAAGLGPAPDAARAAIAAPAGLDAREAAAYRKAVSILHGQVYSPQGRIRHRWTTPDRWPHRDMWLWDSAFHAIGWRHLDPALARDALAAVLDCQRADGFIPHQMNPVWNSELTQPPVLAYAVKLVHETDPRPDWVATLYPGLVRYLAWDVAHRDTDGDGLLEWQIEPDPNCRSGESGLDNSPRFDRAQMLNATDFNSFLAHDYDCLADLARELGRAAEASHWRQIADGLRRRINARLWDAAQGFYFDHDPATDARTGVWACTGFLPLLCGAPDAAMAAALAAHLAPGGTFDTPLPVASVAPREATYGLDCWRGPSWLNTAWLIAEGLARYGMERQAQALRTRWMHTLARDHERLGTLFEYYDAQDAVPPPQLPRKGKVSAVHPHRVIRDYGWTAALYVDWCHRFYQGRSR